MSKDSVADYDTDPNNNTDVGNIATTGGSAPSNFDNSIREIMSHLKKMYLSLWARDNKEWVINGNFSVNQKGASTKSQAVGVYGYDMWKGHASGIEQVIESLPAGEYSLSWTGGGSGIFNGTTDISPIVETVTAGDTSIVVPSTADEVSLKKGDTTYEASPYIPRSYDEELLDCQRYCRFNPSTQGNMNPANTTFNIPSFIQGMRTSSPVFSLENGTGAIHHPGVAFRDVTSIDSSGEFYISLNISTNLGSNVPGQIAPNAILAEDYL